MWIYRGGEEDEVVRKSWILSMSIGVLAASLLSICALASCQVQEAPADRSDDGRAARQTEALVDTLKSIYGCWQLSDAVGTSNPLSDDRSSPSCYGEFQGPLYFEEGETAQRNTLNVGRYSGVTALILLVVDTVEYQRFPCSRRPAEVAFIFGPEFDSSFTDKAVELQSPNLTGDHDASAFQLIEFDYEGVRWVGIEEVVDETVILLAVPDVDPQVWGSTPPTDSGSTLIAELIEWPSGHSRSRLYTCRHVETGSSAVSYLRESVARESPIGCDYDDLEVVLLPPNQAAFLSEWIRITREYRRKARLSVKAELIVNIYPENTDKSPGGQPGATMCASGGRVYLERE